MKVAKLWYLEQFNLMKRLKMNEKMRLADTMDMSSFHKNKQILFPEKTNKSIYFLKKGVVKIGKITESGEEDFQYLLKEGSIFGELALSEGESMNMIAVAVEDCMICHIDVETMRKLMESNSALSTAVLKIMGLRIKKVERRLESILFKDSKTRVTDFVRDFLEEFGERGEDGTITAKNFLSNKDMAKLTATSRQTVNAVLNELKKKGSIDFDTKFIKTKNLKEIN